MDGGIEGRTGGDREYRRGEGGRKVRREAVRKRGNVEAGREGGREGASISARKVKKI